MSKLLFVSGTSNNLKIQLKKPISFNKLYLVQYTITDVPVTASIPDSIHFHLVFENSTNMSITDIATNDSIAGIPIQINGQYTTVQLQQPMLIVNQPVANLSGFQMKLKDDSGSDASFSGMAFWFKYE
jgi:hypothetical protein